MDGIRSIGGGRYEAIEEETSSKICAKNRFARMLALTDLYHKRSGLDFDRTNPYKYWHIESENFIPKCICGHELYSTSYIFNLGLSNGGSTICSVVIGSCCVKHINEEVRELDEEEPGIGTHCPDCQYPKPPLWIYCGKDRCVHCPHGERRYKVSGKKASKTWKAWFCPDRVCKPLWIEDKKGPYRKPAIKKGPQCAV